MADFLEIKRNRPDYSQIFANMAPGLSKGMSAQNDINSVLMPLLFKADLEHKSKIAEMNLKKQYADDFLSRAEKSGRPVKVKYNEFGMPESIEYKGAKEQLEDREAEELLGGSTNGQDYSSSIPSVVSTSVGGSTLGDQESNIPQMIRRRAAIPNIGGIAGRKLQIKAEEARIAAEAKGEAKKSQAALEATSNFARQAGGFKDFARYYAGALKEGGAGNIVNKTMAQAKLKTGYGQEGLADTARLYGQGLELALGAMPLLTKSSRIIEGIFNKLALTYPTGVENAENAAAKLDQSLRNQYVLSVIMKRLGHNINSEQEMQNLSTGEISKIENELSDAFVTLPKTKSLKDVYKLSPEEEAEFEAIKKDVLGPLITKTTKSGVTYRRIK